MEHKTTVLVVLLKKGLFIDVVDDGAHRETSFSLDPLGLWGLHQGARSERRRKSRGSQLGQHGGDMQLRRERSRNPKRGIAPLQVRLRSSLLRSESITF